MLFLPLNVKLWVRSYTASKGTFKYQEEAVSDLERVELFCEQLKKCDLETWTKQNWPDKFPGQNICSAWEASMNTLFLWKLSKKLLKYFILRQSKYFASLKWIASSQMQYNKGKWHFPSDQNKTLGEMLPFHKNEMFLLSPSAERNQILSSTRSNFLGLVGFFEWNLIAIDLDSCHGQSSGDLENEEGQPVLQELQIASDST